VAGEAAPVRHADAKVSGATGCASASQLATDKCCTRFSSQLGTRGTSWSPGPTWHMHWLAATRPVSRPSPCPVLPGCMANSVACRASTRSDATCSARRCRPARQPPPLPHLDVRPVEGGTALGALVGQQQGKLGRARQCAEGRPVVPVGRRQAVAAFVEVVQWPGGVTRCACRCGSWPARLLSN
jgi:hypothetical protein